MHTCVVIMTDVITDVILTNILATSYLLVNNSEKNAGQLEQMEASCNEHIRAALSSQNGWERCKEESREVHNLLNTLYAPARNDCPDNEHCGHVHGRKRCEEINKMCLGCFYLVFFL